MKKCPVCKYECDGGMSLHVGENNTHLYDIEDICPHCIFRMMQDSLPTMMDIPDEKPIIEEEQVFAFNAEHLPYIFSELEEKNYSGFNRKASVTERALHITNTDGRFYSRAEAEKNPSIKQVIPYIICMSEGTLLAYERTGKSGENRLHNKWSIGAGGHVNPCDIPNNIILSKQRGELFLNQAIGRELSEEFGLTLEDGTLKPIGIIYDSSNDVGKVHFGIVYIFQLKDIITEGHLAFNDDAIGEHKFITLAEAIQLPNLENWSQFVLKGLVGGLAR